MSRSHRRNRVITIVCSFLGAVGNGLVAGNIISLCRSLRWEVVESEWEESYASWNFGIDTIKIVWALLSIYFTVSAVACLVGFVGALKVSGTLPCVLFQPSNDSRI